MHVSILVLDMKAIENPIYVRCNKDTVGEREGRQGVDPQGGHRSSTLFSLVSFWAGREVDLSIFRCTR